MSNNRYISKSSFDIVNLLIKQTKSGDLEWISLKELKDYLLDDAILLDNLAVFASYNAHMQIAHNRPIIAHTYITIHKNKIYVLSQKSRSMEFRLDRLRLDEEPEHWQSIIENTNSLIRLFNIIRILDPHNSQDEFAEFLYAINDVQV